MYKRILVTLAVLSLFILMGVAFYGFIIGNNIIVVHCFVQCVLIALWVYVATWDGYDE